MIPIIAALSVSAICGFLYQIWYCRRDPSAAKSIIKTTAIAMLAVVSFLMAGTTFLTMGLILCALGDYFLSRRGERAFLIGLISFALGHICYILIFSYHGDFSTLMTWPRAGFSLLLIFIGSFMARLLWRTAGDLRVPVMIYIAIIMAMGLSAITATGQGLQIAALGAGMFILSDMILSSELFILRDDHPLRRFTPLFVWLFYWMAQIAIFVGVMAT